MPPGPLPKVESRQLPHITLPVAFNHSIIQTLTENLLCPYPPQGGKQTVKEQINTHYHIR